MGSFLAPDAPPRGDTVQRRALGWQRLLQLGGRASGRETGRRGEGTETLTERMPSPGMGETGDGHRGFSFSGQLRWPRPRRVRALPEIRLSRFWVNHKMLTP